MCLNVYKQVQSESSSTSARRRWIMSLSISDVDDEAEIWTLLICGLSNGALSLPPSSLTYGVSLRSPMSESMSCPGVSASAVFRP